MIYEFQATQDLHGYDKPWAPGAGKNLLDASTVFGGESSIYTVNSDGSVTVLSSDSRAWMSCPALNLPAGSYIISKTPTTGTSDIRLATEEYGTSHIFTSQFTFTLSEASSIKIKLAYSGQSYPSTQKVQIESGSTATAWTPFSNICPPEGYNIWDPYNDEFIQVYAGYVNSNTRELYLRPVYEEYAGEELVGPWMSSLDPYAEDTTPTEGAFVIDFGGELESFEITPFMLQTLLDSLGIRQHFTNGAGLLNKLMDQAQGRVRSEEELLHLSRPLKVIAIGDQLPSGITFKPISKDVLPGLPGKFIR